jgi:hypothetical protein
MKEFGKDTEKLTFIESLGYSYIINRMLRSIETVL